MDKIILVKSYIMRIILLITLSFFFKISINAQNEAWNRANSMEKGFNLSNWLEASWLGDNYPDADAYKKSDLVYLKGIGMKTVRMPMLFEWYSDTTTPYKLQETHLAYKLIDSVIKWTGELGMNLIIDNHHGRDLTDQNYLQQIPRLAGMWKQIILKYGYLNPDKVFFELRNEPKNDISNQHLRIVNQAVIDTIRKYNTTHTLIVGANHWNSGGSLILTWPYSDKNIIYTFHNYSPHKFTHQGFTWTGLPSGVVFPETDDAVEKLNKEITDVKAWSDKYNVPVFLGEFGVSTYADKTSRCNWINTMGNVLAKTKIPWAYWDVKHYTNAFGFFEQSILSDEYIIPCFETALGLETATASTGYLKSGSFNIYPNPFQDVLFFEKCDHFTSVRIQLFNTLGSAVTKEIQLQNMKADLSGISSGLYLVKITADENIIFKKIIKI
jgi:endoglucanase